LDEGQVVGLLRAIERYVFVVFALAERRAHTGRSIYLTEASNLYKDHHELGRIVQRIEEETVWRSSADAFVDSVRARQVNQEGFYTWDELRIVLFEYECHLHSNRFYRDDQKIHWNELNERKLGETVEHIYPQTADNQYWVDRFDALDVKAKHVMLHALGNLLLLSRAKNASLGKAAYPVKATEGVECYRNGSFSEISVANDWKEWSPQSICERTSQLLAFVQLRWEVPHWDEASRRILGDLEALMPADERQT
jgi:hypothetical protein